jgi:hypothetical protein
LLEVVHASNHKNCYGDDYFYQISNNELLAKISVSNDQLKKDDVEKEKCLVM